MQPFPSLSTLLATYPLPARKTLGQHFLLNERITDRIAGLAGNLSDTHVIEIGPGPGGLTRSLLMADAKKVVAVEKDARAMPLLAELERLSEGRLTIVEADALKVDAQQLTPAPRAIIANLPYNVGTALLVQWLLQIERDSGVYEFLVLMFQKEVAERLCAAPCSKDYGRLSVLSQWLCEVDYAFELPPGAFSPPPKVSSAVVVLKPRKERLNAKFERLELLLAAGFNQRRKNAPRSA